MFRLTVKHLLVAYAVAILGASLIGIVLRMHDLAQIQDKISDIQGQLVKVQAEMAVQQTIQNNRLDVLEREVFGISPVSGPNKIIIDRGPAAWQINRDRELRRRLLSLEMWRQEMERWIGFEQHQ